MSEKQSQEDEFVRLVARELGRRGGLKGGPARARRMSPEQRKSQARKAGKAAGESHRRRAAERRKAREPPQRSEADR